MSVPKKHHYVPQFLLHNFADERGQLVVRRTDQQREYGASVRDLGTATSGTASSGRIENQTTCPWKP